MEESKSKDEMDKLIKRNKENEKKLNDIVAELKAAPKRRRRKHGLGGRK